jgi:4-alpha-glucanotransferase
LQWQWTDTQGRRQHASHTVIEALADCLATSEEDDAPCLVVDTGDDLPPGAGSPRTRCFDEQERSVPLLRGGHSRFRAPQQPGYYRLRDGNTERVLAVAPSRCFTPWDLAQQNHPALWGIATQVYSLRGKSGGLGTSADIAALGQHIAMAGGDAVALSPLHASAPVSDDFSPYAPSHRGMLDWMQVEPSQVVGADAWRDALAHSGMETAWLQAEHSTRLDWPGQYAMRRRTLQALFERWGHKDKRWRQFATQAGEPLRLHAVFAARQALAIERGECVDWQRWSAAWCRPDPVVVAAFTKQHAKSLHFELFLQWLAAACWARTRDELGHAGQRLGLCWDLAVGFIPGGSEAWQHAGLIVRGASLGAPADAFNPHGQAWGISTYSPQGLRRSGYRPLIELLRACMARGGGIRIDHILGWSRLWLVPDGASAGEGAYVRYPLEDMLRLLALESWRHRCVVIGEDLGTVPAGLRARLARRGVLGLDVLLFTRDARRRFLPPKRWRSSAVAMSGTHDLPPLAAWREARDVDALARIQHWTERMLRAALAARRRDIAALDRMTMASGAATPLRAAVRAVAQSPAPLALIPLEDVLGSKQQVNLPGTVREHPNWRLRMHWDRPQLTSMLRWIERQRRSMRHD